MTWPELMARALDTAAPVLVKTPAFPHLCPGSGCQICHWLERPQ